MTPDFPEEKQRIMEALTHRLRQRHSQLLGPFSSSTAYAHHEGDYWQIHRADGSVERQEYMRIGGQLSVELDEVPDMKVETLLKKIDDVAETAAADLSRAIYSHINRAIDEAGTGIDAGGRPLDQDLFLKALDAIDWDFDKDGNPTNIAIVMHPKVWESHKDIMKAWESDPAFVSKHSALQARKREEWNARESRRTLVD